MIEEIRLNLIPNGVSPVCHVSQYDEGRQIKINLFEGINAYVIQSGDTFTLNVRKPDNTIVTTSVSGTQGNNYITISTTQQIAAVVGENLCELKITNGSTVIGTLNFVMQVERDVLTDGIPSQSVIEDLDERIAEAIGDNYYNKTETDALLNNKADKSNTYNKTETDSLLALKADKSNTYTKSETDALLALKADKSELYNVYPTEQESGAIASFTDGGDNIPLKSCEVTINPDLSGKTECNLVVCGKNLAYEKNGNNKVIAYVKGGVTYTFSCSMTGGNAGCNIKDNATGEVLAASGGGTLANPLTFTPNEDCEIYLNGFSLTAGKTFVELTDNFQIEVGNQATAFEPYNATTYNIPFGQTVYGGSGDMLTGEFVSAYAKVDLGSLTWAKGQTSQGNYRFFSSDLSSIIKRPATNDNVANLVCSDYQAKSFNDVNNNNTQGIYCHTNGSIGIFDSSKESLTDLQFKTAMNGVYLVYELATPTSLSLTPISPKSLYGNNNIYADTGDVDVTIRADIGLYIDKRLNVSHSTPNNLIRAALYVDDPESVNETQEDSVEPQLDTQENNEER